MLAFNRELEMFTGRESELAFLEGVSESKGMRTCAVMGRRRIGKSMILERFCEGRRSLYVEFENSSEARNTGRLAEAVSRLTGRAVEFEGFGDALEAIGEVCREERTVVVFDEYPYLTACVENASEMLKTFIDTVLNRTESMLVICGSSITVMRDEISRRDGPLYGRFQNRLEVGPMPMEDCRALNPDLDDGDFLRLYLTLGGVPMYHVLADGPDYRDCIKRLFLGPTPLLGDEADAIVDRELKPAWKYNGILDLLAGGEIQLTEIASKMKMDPTTCRRYLKAMESIGLVETVHPMLDAPKGPTYTISDGLLAFQFKVLRKYVRSINKADPDMVYDELRADISTFLGKRFESFCADFLQRNYVCREVGRWWGREGIGAGTDIDVVAIVRHGGVPYTILGECKLRGRETGFEALNSLKERASRLSRDRAVRLFLFSGSGFKDGLADHAEENGIMLADLEVLMGRKPAPGIPSQRS